MTTDPILPASGPVENPDDLNERLQELEFLQNLDRELNSVLNLEHVLDITLDWAIRRTAADTGLIAKKVDNGLQVVRVMGSAFQYATTLMREPLSMHSGIIGRAAESGKPVYMAYVTSHADQSLIYAGSRSQFTVPLVFRGEVLGVLHLESRRPTHFNTDMRAFVIHVANRASIAFRNADLYTRTYNAEQLKSDMIRMAAHDLRNPLNAVINGVFLLKRLREQMPDLATRAIENIEGAANQMRLLIDELLTLERIESALQISDHPVNLVTALQDALMRMRNEAESKSHELMASLPSKAIIVSGELALFRQAMINLISNAVKYTPEHGKIIVRLERMGSRAFFEVEDNGFGISPDRQTKVFQRFYRAREPGTEGIEGTGLGLSLVKAIIERSEGEVWFNSEAGKGSTFGFWLPSLDGVEVGGEETSHEQKITPNDNVMGMETAADLKLAEPIEQAKTGPEKVESEATPVPTQILVAEPVPVAQPEESLRQAGSNGLPRQSHQ
ncbi:MAG: GAF domain-containing sensor histidine kinase [Chloroflexi bacterium]|nr:GAF domain-containing sensor histidine kinase [Chloroflexota bacterium]